MNYIGVFGRSIFTIHTLFQWLRMVGLFDSFSIYPNEFYHWPCDKFYFRRISFNTVFFSLCSFFWFTFRQLVAVKWIDIQNTFKLIVFFHHRIANWLLFHLFDFNELLWAIELENVNRNQKSNRHEMNFDLEMVFFFVVVRWSKYLFVADYA